VIPQWHLKSQRILYWDKFGLPEITPKSGTSTNLWWYDITKAEEIGRAVAPSDSTNNPNSKVYLFIALLVVIGFFAFKRLNRKNI
jgi:hypothetical protein